MLDILIKDGTIVNGTGTKRYKGNIGIKDGKIEYIGECNADAKKVIDAEGFIVSPGFIDYHSHSDYSLLDEKVNFANYLEQGITTQIVGMCGGTTAPSKLQDIKDLFSMLIGEIDEEQAKQLANDLKDFNSYFKSIEKKQLGTNMAFYIGHGTVRTAVIGPYNRKPTEEEMYEMKNHVRIAMEAGALGLSTGLIYPPGAYADEDELVELCKVVAEYGGSYCSHMRSEGDRLFEAVEEAINIGRRACVPVNISHIKVAGKNNWGKSDKLISLIDKANEEGIKVTADMYPYKAGATNLNSAVPPKYASDGQAALLEKMKNPKFRAQVKEELFNQTENYENLIVYCGFDGMQILNSPIKSIIGKTITQIAEERKKDEFETFCDLIIESNGGSFCAFFMRNDKDIDKVFKHPVVMGGTDGGIESKTFPMFHPRHMGTFPKLLKDLVIEKKLVTLEEGIMKFCKLPAETAKLETKGLLKKGYDADVLVFDLESINYTSDYFNPKGKNKGFKYVIVNGQIAVTDDNFTGVYNGRLLRVK